MAVICSKCGHDNVRGALVCEQCFTLLMDTAPVGRTTAFTSEQAAALAKTLARPGTRTKHFGKLGTHGVALYIADQAEPMIVLIATQAVFGRAVPGDTQLRIDLTPYGALEKGVSRQHAILKRTERGLMLEDMGSSNGTWLNADMLRPYTPTRITSGDQIRLGQVGIEIYLPEFEV